jgi:hypothetical protein
LFRSPGLLLLLLLISNQKHIKLVVTVGALEKWKFSEKLLRQRLAVIYPCPKPLFRLAGGCGESGRRQSSGYVFHLIHILSTGLAEKTFSSSEKPRFKRDSHA